ncbi:SMP-30/gluconolactonase/LRE family protein [Hymenobacter cellulosivorans]|uniref:SMP-30/gluconolactonase/LRE family protein n=1 Tax=Hymenobacter cellulosivorans TaxID=2932249 RepID=A0ABY4FFU3_9BACT|nr:SMP-30/gluconolactonase/LRE family protein [Hymenobacter cellulosivorans]UOQ53306.1 SMP-30/gluconolactonase/LRE family protein [Hymenobacter cellulosivorans]
MLTFTAPGLFPEGVQYDATNQAFLVSSLTTGNVGRVKDDNTYSLLAAGQATGIASAVGLHLDEARTRVLVASANAVTGNVAKLVSLDRDKGTVTFTADLGALRPSASGHFANDIAVDEQGNAYVTDSFAPVIYKVTAQGVASVFLDDARLAAGPGAFGLNGLVFRADATGGYLLVAKTDEGVLFKVPLSNPANFTLITVPGVDLRGADGLLLQNDNTLQVVAGTQNKVYRLTTSTNWVSATLSGTFATSGDGPTTLARRNGADSYVLYANLSAIMTTPPPTTYSVGKVSF